MSVSGTLQLMVYAVRVYVVSSFVALTLLSATIYLLAINKIVAINKI